MAKDLVLDVVARKNSKDLEALALEFDKLAAAVDGSNKSSQQSVKFSKFLDDQIAETKKQVQSLAQTFEKTGSADAFGQLRGANRNLSVLERLRKQTIDLAGAEGEAKQELSGLDAEVQRLSSSYFELTRDHLAPARAEFDKLNDRLKTQSETVKILEQRYRESGAVLDQLDLRNARLDLERLDEETKGLADSLVNLKRSVPQHKDLSFGDFVKAETQKARVEVDRLRADLSKGGGFNVFGDLRKAEADLDVLEKVGKQATADFAKAGEGAGFGLMQGVAYGIGAAAPIVLPAAGGLILGGLGLGVIAAGIVGQLHSPEVVAGLAQLKSDAGGVFKDVTSPFGPVLAKGLSDADDALKKISPELTAMFKEAAPAADALFKGIDGFVEKSIPGLHKGLDGAVIVIDELGKDLPGVGKAIGTAFAGVAVGAQGDAHALHDLLTVTDQLIVSGGRLAGQSGQLYEQLRSIATLKFDSPTLSMKSLQDTFDAVSTGGVTVLFKAITGVGDKSKDVTYQVDNLGKSLNDLGPAAKTSASALKYLNGELDSMIGKQLTLAGANNSFKEGLFTLKDQLDKNNKSLSDNSLAGLQNQDVFVGMIGKAEAARQAAIDHAGGVNASKAAVDQANASYEQAITNLVNAGVAAGASRTELEKLAGNYQINVLLAIDAIYKSGLAQNVAAHDPGRYGSAGPPRRAGGGPAMAGKPYIVGENRPELFVPDVNGTIVPRIPAPLPYKTFGGATGISGPARATLSVIDGGGSAVGTFINELVRTGVIRLSVSNGAVVAG